MADESSLSVLILTYNVAAKPLSDSLVEALTSDAPPDLVCISVQEFCPVADMFLPWQDASDRVEAWARAVSSALATSYGPRRCDYERLAARSLGGVLHIVFGRIGLAVRSIATDAFGIGPLWLPNKAMVSSRITLDAADGTRLALTFVAAHLEPHPGGYHLRTRNRQVTHDLFERTLFLVPDAVDADSLSSTTPLLGGQTALTIWDSDAVFLAGDFNYRIRLPRPETLAEIQSERFQKLVADGDELTAAKQEPSHGLHPFFERDISWPPSYKYKGATEFSKLRTPSYTDRILFSYHHPHDQTETLREAYRSEAQPANPDMPVLVRAYRSFMGYNKSDHKPVRAEFTVRPKALASRARTFATTTDPWREIKAWIGIRLLAPPIGVVLHVPDRPVTALAVLCTAAAAVYVALWSWGKL
ncbi:Endonuclease/exonuclease/phosphatase [Hyaloraphidium curvatum]|nr:Endonuclease/exonuclease/phosphatase [Hyaloraphidium curvatum]